MGHPQAPFFSVTRGPKGGVLGLEEAEGQEEVGQKGHAGVGLHPPWCAPGQDTLDHWPLCSRTLAEVPTGQSRFRESQLALCHHLTATLIL